MKGVRKLLVLVLTLVLGLSLFGCGGPRIQKVIRIGAMDANDATRLDRNTASSGSCVTSTAVRPLSRARRLSSACKAARGNASKTASALPHRAAPAK